MYENEKKSQQNEENNKIIEEKNKKHIELQKALDDILDFFENCEEDIFIIHYLYYNSTSISEHGSESTFKTMLRLCPRTMTEEKLKNRAIKLCKSENEVHVWYLITKRYQDASIPKHIPEYREFQRILTLLRYHILPVNDPSYPIAPTFHPPREGNSFYESIKLKPFNEENELKNLKTLSITDEQA